MLRNKYLIIQTNHGFDVYAVLLDVFGGQETLLLRSFKNRKKMNEFFKPVDFI